MQQNSSLSTKRTNYKIILLNLDIDSSGANNDIIILVSLGFFFFFLEFEFYVWVAENRRKLGIKTKFWNILSKRCGIQFMGFD